MEAALSYAKLMLADQMTSGRFAWSSCSTVTQGLSKTMAHYKNRMLVQEWLCHFSWLCSFSKSIFMFFCKNSIDLSIKLKCIILISFQGSATIFFVISSIFFKGHRNSKHSYPPLLFLFFITHAFSNTLKTDFESDFYGHFKAIWKVLRKPFFHLC